MKNKIDTEFSNKLILSGKQCPYCNGKSEYVDSSEVYSKSYGMIYLCRKCMAWVGTHKGTEQSLGRLADKLLREAKKKAHYYFDQLWNEKLRIWMKKKDNHSKKEISAMRRIVRNQAYNRLSQKMELPSEHTHIGMFNVARCVQVIKICKPYCKNE